MRLAGRTTTKSCLVRSRCCSQPFSLRFSTAANDKHALAFRYSVRSPDWKRDVRVLLQELEADVLRNARVGYNRKEEELFNEGEDGMTELSRLLLGSQAQKEATDNEGEDEEETNLESEDEGEEDEEDEESGVKQQDEFLDLKNRQPEDLPFPYRLLDWRWYKRTQEDERIRQLLQWKPFSRRGAQQLAGERAFKENPFAAPSPLARTPWELEQYRRMRLEVFFSDQLGRLTDLMDNAYSGQIHSRDDIIPPAVLTFEETTAALITDLRIIDRKIREAKMAKQDAEQVAAEVLRLEETPVTEKERSTVLLYYAKN